MIVIEKNKITEKVQEAKEKLGDRNMTLMAEILELEQFDENKKTALSPFRKEDTPSFSFDSKRYRWKDFGSDRTVDIVDALIYKGNTYIQAIKKLFEYADMDIDIEVNHKKDDYKYPHDENGNMQPVIEYWGKRRISKDTLEYLDVGADEHGNTVFKFFNQDDELLLVKYRPSRQIQKGENKTWCQKGASKSNILFNMNRVDFSKPLLIVEGEGCCMSAIEAGFYNTVSIPLGCANSKWIDECWDQLMQCPEIIISFDNDEPGIKARKNVIDRLGCEKCKYIEYPKSCEGTFNGVTKSYKTKDMNDVWRCTSSAFVLNMIANAKELPIDTVVDPFTVEEESIYDMEGIESGISAIDDLLVQFPFSSLTILSGRAGSGKTSLIDQILLNSLENNHNVFLFSLEMTTGMSTSWLNLIAGGRRNAELKTNKKGKKYYAASNDIKKKIAERYKDMICSYKDNSSSSVDDVFKSMEACVRRKNCRVCIIDNLMKLQLNCTEESKNTAQTDLINRLISFAQTYNVAIFLICHFKKGVVGSYGFTSPEEELENIAGSSNIGNLSMRALSLTRISEKQKHDPKYKYANYNVILRVSKDRYTPEVGKEIPLHYDTISRRFFSNYYEYDRQYSFDTNKYTDKLPYDFIDEINPFE